MKNLFFLLVILLFTCHCTTKNESQQHVETMQNLEWLHFSEIKPKGWILHQMTNDLEQGFVGHLDELVPEILVDDDIYGKDRIDTEKSKLGTLGKMWWNSESQSNWWDGYIRHAVLTENEAAMAKAKKYIDKMLATQDEDGYLGIYAEDLRFQHTIENGEFWAQSSLFRALLGWYEATSDEKVLAAIENAVKKIMEAYPINHSDPFNLKNARGGAGHGITITDALNRLYQLTGKTEYLDYAVFLFNNFDKYNMRDEDVKTKNLLDENYVFNYHSAHTCEQIRSLIVAAYHTKDSVLMLAMDNYFKKMKNHLCASGGPIGDEWFHRRLAHADSTGYEYCSIHELHDSYSFMLQKSGKTKWADKMEWLLFNAAQGARHPKESAVTYCQTDNVYKLKGDLFFYEEKENPNKRFKLSPTHVDVAVCCAPNAGRIYPYYVKAMWMRSENGLVANLFGPSELNTLVNGKKVKIIQQTTYPFDFNVDFIIACEEANEFEIAIRKPAWAKIAVVYSEALLREDDQYLYLEKTWQDGDKIQLIMQADVKTNTDLQGKKYISYGPLVFALPLFGKATEIKRYGNTKFRDLHYEPTQDVKKDFIFDPDASFEVEQGKVNEKSPWKTWKISSTMIDPADNQKHKVEFYPMGSTILRKVCIEKQ